MVELRARSLGGVVVKLALDVSAVPDRPAGAGRYVVELANRLAHEPLELALATRRTDWQRWRVAGEHVAIKPLIPASRAMRLAYEAYGLGRSPLARSVDVWHSPHYSMPHRCAAPVVVTIHDLTFFTHPQFHERAKVAFFSRAIRYAAREAAVIITVSEFTARQLNEFAPTTRPVVVAPHGVDLDHFAPNGTDHWPLDLPDRARPYVLFVGTVEPRKGIDILLEAFRELATDDSDVELWLAGQDGWGVRTVEDQLRAHPFAHRVRRLGYVDDAALPSLLRGARVVAYPSRGEGFGLPVLEAMACGAPVVTTVDTVMAEVAGDAATLTPAGDAPALARSLATVLGWRDDERRDAAVASRRRAETYTWDYSLAQHLHAYHLASSTH